MGWFCSMHPYLRGFGWLYTAVSIRSPSELRPKRTCLRIEEVNNWQEGSVSCGPDEPEFPTQVLNSNGGNFDNDEVRDPAHPRSEAILIEIERGIERTSP